MKKALSLLLIAFILIATLASCNETTEQPSGESNEPTTQPTETEAGITKEEWQAAIADEKFDNVTILFDVDYVDGDNAVGAADHEQTLKICGGKVYRTATMLGDTFSMYFTDEMAVSQRKMFLDIFLALLAEKDNYEYDAETKTYVAPEKISVTVYPSEGTSDLVEMEEGVVKFDDNGRLVSFSCKLKETATTTYEGQTNTVTLPLSDTTWTFSNYGTTEITAEEIVAAAAQNGPDSDGPESNEAENASPAE